MYSKATIDTHVWIPKDELAHGLSAVKKKLTAVSKYEDENGDFPTVPLYRESGGLFGVPRYYFKTIPAREVVYSDSIGTPVSFKFRSDQNHPKYPMQQTMVNRFEKGLKNNNTGFLIVAATGAGKTIILLKCIQILARTALVIVPKSDLVNQWIRRIGKHTDIKRKDIGVIQQDRCEYKDKKIVVAMMQSLALRKNPYPSEIYDYFGTVVVDEAHKSACKILGKAPLLFKARYRLGASATPKRKDGMDAILNYHFAQVTLNAKGDEMPTPKVYVRYVNTKPIKTHSGMSFMARRSRVITTLSRNTERSFMIAEYVSQMFQKGRKIVVFSDRLAQLDMIKAYLKGNFSVPDKEIGKYIGKAKGREKMAERCRILLATYQSMDMGTDIPSLDALVFATPRSDIVQAVGRILRFQDGKKQPFVLDLVDTTTKECIIMAKSRERQYFTLGYEVIKKS